MFRFKSGEKNKKNINDWVDTIKAHLSESKGAKESIDRLSVIHRF